MSEQISPTPHNILDGAGRIGADLACVSCGHNLRTQPVDGNCPGCGRAVAESATGYLPQLDRAGHVAGDLPCVICGYNLRMQPATALCPECAAPVGRSARGNFLRDAPTRWVNRLARGALLLIIAIVGGIVLSIATIAAAMIIEATAGRVPDGADTALGVLLCIISGGSLALLVIGLLHLTAPDPVGKFRKEGFTARRLVRWCGLAAPLLVLSAVLLPPLPGVRGIMPSPFFPGLHAFLFLCAFMILVLALLRHIATLMRRIPRPGLVTFAKIEFWFFLVATIVYVGGFSSLMFATFRMAATFAAGPNMPALAYAGGPNSPGAATPTSAPTPGPVYYSTATYQLTQVGPGGVVTTTTMPATGPVTVTPPPFGPFFFLASILSMVGGCTMLGVYIAGFVLLILVWRALAQAARQAEALAGGSPGGE